MDYRFSTTVAPHPVAGHTASMAPPSDSACVKSNPTAMMEFSDDGVSPASTVSKHSSYHYAEDDSGDDIIFPEGENSPPLLNSLQVNNIDQLVAQELSKLSLNERQKALYDLHAVMNMDDLRQPSPEIQRSLLQQVQRIIREDLPPSDKRVYEQALQMDASYVHDDKFVFKFLRADSWDPKRAAARLVKHFKVKLELFPSDLLCQDIIQDDLDPLTLAALYGDLAHDLPLRDMAGRIVTFIIPGPGHEVLTKVRRSFYSAMVKAEDEETQLKGRVVVIWLANIAFGMDTATAWKVAQVAQGLPIKHSAVHVCVPNIQPNAAYSSILAWLGSTLERLDLVRMKCHYGSPVDLKCKLQDFGIPPSVIPISDSGEVICKQANMKWAARRLQERLRRLVPPESDPQNKSSLSGSTMEHDVGKGLQLEQPSGEMPTLETLPRVSSPNEESESSDPPPTEETESLRSVPSPNEQTESLRSVPSPNEQTESLHSVVTPSNRDVLLGRGRLCRDHVGNIMLRQYMDKLWHIFEALQTKGAKSRMAGDVVRQVKIEFGGRFLEEKGFGWTEVPDKVARTKVATYFRTLRSNRRKDQAMNF